MFDKVFEEQKTGKKNEKDVKPNDYSNRIIFLTDAMIVE